MQWVDLSLHPIFHFKVFDFLLNLYKKYIRFLRLPYIRIFFNNSIKSLLLQFDTTCCWCQLYYANILETIYFVIFGFLIYLICQKMRKKYTHTMTIFLFFQYESHNMTIRKQYEKSSGLRYERLSVTQKHKLSNLSVLLYFAYSIQTGKTCLTGVRFLI